MLAEQFFLKSWRWPVRMMNSLMESISGNKNATEKNADQAADASADQLQSFDTPWRHVFRDCCLVLPLHCWRPYLLLDSLPHLARPQITLLKSRPGLRQNAQTGRSMIVCESVDTVNAPNIARILLGAALAFAGISHLTFARHDFLAQVPPWVPLNPDTVVLLSGVVEIALGLAMILLVRYRVALGWLMAAFFVAVFPGNIAQLMYHRDAFGLNSDTARTIRLFFQPVLIAWALWSTGAWNSYRHKNVPAQP